MNIASSPDPIPATARGETSAAGPAPARDSADVQFSDLLGAKPDAVPDDTAASSKRATAPRKQQADGTDPTLAMLLPFMMPQPPQTPPAAPSFEGAAFEIAGGNSAGVPQSDSTTPLSVQPGVMSAMSFAVRKDSTVPNVAAEVTNESANGETNALPQPGSVPDAAAEIAPAAANVALGTPTPTLRSALQPAFQSAIQPTPQPTLQPAIQPAIQPAQAAVPGLNAPAEIASLAVKIIPPTTPSSSASRPENSAGQRQPQEISDPASVKEARGTVAAKDRRNMTEQSPDRASQAQANVAAELPETQEQPVVSRKTQTAQAAPAMAGFTFGTQADGGRASDAPGTGDVKAAAQVTQQTFDLAEHVRTTGRDNVEVQMRLNDGHEVTVSLRFEHGEWKPVFKTDTEALCRALEQNWHQAAAQPSVQGVKFGTAVFETQRTQGDLGQNPQQQSGGRERSFSRREQEPAFGNPVPQPRAAAKPVRAAASTAVQLYA